MMFTPKVDTIHYDARVFTYSFPQLITKDTCKEYRNQFPHSSTSNVHAWHSGYNAHKKSNVFQPLVDTVLLMCYDISKEYYNVPVTDPYHYEVDDLWLSMYEKNDYTVMHDHFPATFDACYYVDVKEFNGLSEQKNKYSSSPITFNNGFHIVEHTNPNLKKFLDMCNANRDNPDRLKTSTPIWFPRVTN